jgi:hypothetical protein
MFICRFVSSGSHPTTAADATPMFRITRGISIEPAPAYPSPALRFPDSTPIRIYAEDERAPQPDAANQEEQQKS